jgi:RNA polymerase sigma factor (sigma-70 family)
LAVEAQAAPPLLDRAESERIERSLVYLARRRFRLARDVAEDLVQSALVTYLEVRDRYPRTEEHFRILVGIFRNKCREHIERAVRSARGFESLRRDALANGPAAGPLKCGPAEDDVLAHLIEREDGRRIVAALARLRPQAREMFRLITEEGLSRRELMERFRLNKNTLDSRLHTYRRELREMLERKDPSP